MLTQPKVHPWFHNAHSLTSDERNKYGMPAKIIRNGNHSIILCLDIFSKVMSLTLAI